MHRRQAILTESAISIALLIGSIHAHAAEVTIVPTQKDAVPVVAVIGDIVPGDYKKFQQTVAPLTKAIVAFKSDGGSVLDGVKIGRLIRLKNFKTVVMNGDHCASACALAWLGGTSRYMGATAAVGFHAAYNKYTGQETGAGNALVGAYLNEIGLSYSAVFYITRAAPNSMTWLTFPEANKVGIDVSLLRLPSRAEPAVQSTSPSTDVVTVLQERSIGFVHQIYQWMSQSNEAAFPNINALYADSVSYFGNVLSRGDAVAQEERFMARWPIRRYRADPNSMQASCNSLTLECVVSGVLEFEAKSPILKQISTGKATFRYNLKFSSEYNEPRIIAETGNVFERNIQALGPNLPQDLIPFGVPPPSETNLVRRSRQFVEDLYALISSQNDRVAAKLPLLYADRVNYFGKEISRDETIAEERHFIARWPIRHYSAEMESVAVKCKSDELRCDVTGIMEFNAQSPVRNQRSMGKATFSYRLRYSSVDAKIPEIVSEDGKVLERHVSPLSTTYDNTGNNG